MNRITKAIRALFGDSEGKKGLSIVGATPGYWGDGGLYAGRRNSVAASAARFVRRAGGSTPMVLMRPGKDGSGDETLTLRSTDLTPAERWVLEILHRPLPELAGAVCWPQATADIVLANQAYFHIERDGYSFPKTITYCPPDRVMTQLIGGELFYRMDIWGRNVLAPAADVIHPRDNMDAGDPWRGAQDLLTVSKEILGDAAGAEYVYGALANPTQGLYVSPPEGVTLEIGKEDSDALVEQFERKAGGPNRGRTVVTNLGMKLQTFGIAPRDMDAGAIRAQAVERICAVLGFDPMVLGLSSSSKTYSNYGEAIQAAYEGTLIPTQDLLAAEMTAKWISLYPSLKGHYLAFDRTKVRALRDDLDALWKRAGEAWDRSITTLDETRALLKYPPIGGEEGTARRPLMTSRPHPEQPKP